MEHKEQDGGLDVVLKELITLHEDASKSRDSNHRSGLDLILRELMTQREKAAVATERLETERMMTKQQNDFQLRLQKQQEEYMAKLEQEKREHQERLEQERREHNLKQEALLARQDQERCEERRVALEQQERQHTFFREVIQQLQEEVKGLRHGESGAPMISDTQEKSDSPGGHKTPAPGSPYPITPLSLMETPSKPFDDWLVNSDLVENLAAEENGSVDETINYVENDAVEEEEPTSVMESDQGSVVLSDKDLRAKGLISSEESFLLNKSGQVGNKDENAKGKKLPLQKMATSKSRALRDAKEKMKMIAGKLKLIAMLICEEMGNVGQKDFFENHYIASRLG